MSPHFLLILTIQHKRHSLQKVCHPLMPLVWARHALSIQELRTFARDADTKRHIYKF